MRTMSLLESGESNGKVSLRRLFSSPSEEIYAESSLSLEQIAFLVCRGGWSISTYLEGNSSLDMAFDYLDAVIHSDLFRVDHVRRSSEKMKRILVSYARNQGNQMSYETIVENLKINEDESMNTKTVSSYIDVLKKIFVIEDLPAWNPNLRSKKAIRTADT